MISLPLFIAHTLVEVYIAYTLNQTKFTRQELVEEIIVIELFS